MKTDSHPSADVWATLGYARFLLATWVLFAHTHNFCVEENAIPVPSKNALVAVYCFLAISGFSIHHSISSRPSGYLFRRFWRIAPTHFVSVLLALVAYWSVGPILSDGRGNPWPMPPISSWVFAFFLLQALVPIARIAVLFPSWSLSIESAYYALALMLFRAKRARWIVGACLCSLLFCLIRPKISSLYVGSDTYGISILALAWAWIGGWLLRSETGKLARLLFVGVIGSVAISLDTLLEGWFNHLAWWLTLYLMAYSRGEFFSRLTRSVGNYLGELSYPLYLVHYPVIFLFYNAFLKTHQSINTGFVHVFVAVFTAGILLHFFDFPLRYWALARMDKK